MTNQDKNRFEYYLKEHLIELSNNPVKLEVLAFKNYIEAMNFDESLLDDFINRCYQNSDSESKVFYYMLLDKKDQDALFKSDMSEFSL